MNFFSRLSICIILFAIISAVCACQKPQEKKKANLVFTHHEFTVRQTHGNSYVMDVTGRIKNASDFDVKKVVVTAFCRSCGQQMLQSQWFISDLEKTPNQVDTISYLAAGAEEEFAFQEVAFQFTYQNVEPEPVREGIEMVVQSYEVVAQ